MIYVKGEIPGFQSGFYEALYYFSMDRSPSVGGTFILFVGLIEIVRGLCGCIDFKVSSRKFEGEDEGRKENHF